MLIPLSIILFIFFSLVLDNLVNFFFEELHGITEGLDVFWQFRHIFRREGFVFSFDCFDFRRGLTCFYGSFSSLVNIVFKLFDICSYDVFLVVLWLVSDPLAFGDGVGRTLDLGWGRSLLLEDLDRLLK